jgi:hypothetical protein
LMLPESSLSCGGVPADSFKVPSEWRTVCDSSA